MRQYAWDERSGLVSRDPWVPGSASIGRLNSPKAIRRVRQITRLLSVVGKRRLILFSLGAFGIALATIVTYAVYQYPRQTLLSDVRQSKRIIVNWRALDENENRVLHTFELNDSSRGQFVRVLTENLELDYFRGEATASPMIGICLLDNNNELSAYYVIRYAGGGRCPSMESLRNTASKGRPLSETEVDRMFDDRLRSKWPCFFSNLEFRFDYVLPVVPSGQR